MTLKLQRRIAFFSSVFLVVVLWMIGPYFMVWVNDFLQSINKFMDSWSLNHPIFALSIGLVPYLSFGLWKMKGSKNLNLLIAYISIFWSLLILEVILAFVMSDYFIPPHSPFLPDYIVFLPFVDFWNVVLPLSTISTWLIIYLTINRKQQQSNEVVDDLKNA